MKEINEVDALAETHELIERFKKLKVKTDHFYMYLMDNVFHDFLKNGQINELIPKKRYKTYSFQFGYQTITFKTKKAIMNLTVKDFFYLLRN